MSQKFTLRLDRGRNRQLGIQRLGKGFEMANLTQGENIVVIWDLNDPSGIAQLQISSVWCEGIHGPSACSTRRIFNAWHPDRRSAPIESSSIAASHSDDPTSADAP
jgi:hypothetical protein